MKNIKNNHFWFWDVGYGIPKMKVIISCTQVISVISCYLKKLTPIGFAKQLVTGDFCNRVSQDGAYQL